MHMLSLNLIRNESNRKHTNDDSFGQFVESVRKHGIIEPPIVRALGPGGYRTVAGRRRIEAARALGHETVWCEVMEADDPRSDDEIAATENINRLDMHPLDEAALFAGMAERGATVEEIARRYARSPSAIYKRLRLAGLAEELKAMFRDGVLGIGSAAVLAELPEEDQEAFFSQYGTKWGEIPSNWVMTFVGKRQRFTITEGMAGCEDCARRTHNQNNELFDEFQYMEDVCMDADCYRRKWKAIIEKALADCCDPGLPTDAKIIFRGAIPELLYKRATHVEFFVADKDTRFEVIRDNDYEITGGTKKKTGACWLVHTAYDGETTAERVGYKLRPPAEKQEKGKGSAAAGLVERYGRETLEAVAAERGDTAESLARKLEEKGNSYRFNDMIGERVLGRAIARRVEAEASGELPPRDYFSMFLRYLDGQAYLNDWKDLSGGRKKWLRDLTGKESLAGLARALSDHAQRHFHFLLLACGALKDDIPNLGGIEDIEKSASLFWEYAGMEKEEYRALWLEEAKAATARALGPKPKGGGKKKAGRNGGGGAPAEAGEDSYPFEPDPDTEAADGPEEKEDDFPF
jgi:ParB/RepB/Spo0J family partition protein